VVTIGLERARKVALRRLYSPYFIMPHRKTAMPASVAGIRLRQRP
jgi:hypothetical protein